MKCEVEVRGRFRVGYIWIRLRTASVPGTALADGLQILNGTTETLQMQLTVINLCEGSEKTGKNAINDDARRGLLLTPRVSNSTVWC